LKALSKGMRTKANVFSSDSNSGAPHIAGVRHSITTEDSDDIDFIQLVLGEAGMDPP